MIKNLIFDIGNVLVRFHPEEELVRYTGSMQEAEALRDLIWLSKPWKDADRGLTEREGTVSLLTEMYPDKADMLVKILHECSDWLVMPDGTEVLLEDLAAAGYNLYILSNTNPGDFDSMTRRYPVLSRMPGIVSFREGVLKPEPAIFQLLLSRCGLDPGEGLFVDDMPVNTAAASAEGLHTLCLTGGAETLREALLTHPLLHFKTP